jgi:hypothetical protein
MRLAPSGTIELSLISDFEQTRRFVRDKYRVTHSAARPPVGRRHFLPECQTPEL